MTKELVADRTEDKAEPEHSFPEQARDFVTRLDQEMRAPLGAIIESARLLEAQPDAPGRSTNVQHILRAAFQLLSVLDRQLIAPPLPPNSSLGAAPTNAVTYDVLYIEDDPVNFTLVERILESRPRVRVQQASNGESGVELALGQRPQLILLDLNLPDIHGSEVLRRLRENPITAPIPIIVISADATGSQIERLLQAGARNYLTKPFNIQQFLAVVDEVLAK